MIDVNQVREAFNASPEAKILRDAFIQRSRPNREDHRRAGRNVRNGQVAFHRYWETYLKETGSYKNYQVLWNTLAELDLVAITDDREKIEFKYTLRSIGRVLMNPKLTERDLIVQVLITRPTRKRKYKVKHKAPMASDMVMYKQPKRESTSSVVQAFPQSAAPVIIIKRMPNGSTLEMRFEKLRDAYEAFEKLA